jgi:SAM-dependent methyltransferase
MPRWHEGYICDVEYTAGFMREMTPAWLAFVALLLGHHAPDPAGRLHIADLGCGHAITDAVVAASYPGAEVWALDFAPPHVESGRRLAGLSGLANLHVEERSFADLARAARGTWPEFDIVTLHGVWSWITPATAEHVVGFIDRFLRPGGLVYVSSNTLAGWASMLPLQRLMHGMARSGPDRADAAAQAAVALLLRLREGRAAFFAQNPAAAARLDALRNADPRYLAHEYLHAHWHPVSMGDVATALARAKCEFLGSAVITDNIIEAVVPAPLVETVKALGDPLLQEMVGDLASARPFRRDIYRRGAGRLTVAETQDRLDRLSIAGLGQPSDPGHASDFASAQIAGRPELYAPLLERLAEGPLPLRAAMAMPCLRAASMVDVLQAFALLVSGGRAHPVLEAPAGSGAARRLNVALAGLNALGVERPLLAAPVIGSAIDADAVEVMAVGELLAGAAPDPVALTDRVGAALARAGRAVQHDGVMIADPAEARRRLAETIGGMLSGRVPVFRRLGILDG